MTNWETAHLYEKAHWQRLITEAKEGKSDFWFGLWQEQADYLWPLLEHSMPVGDDTIIVEIGAGLVGMVRLTTKGKRIIVDPLANMQRQGYEELFGGSDVRIIPTRAEVCTSTMKGEVSIVLALDTLDHCQAPNKVLDAVHGMLKTEGIFCESTTIFHEPTEWTDNEYGKYHPWFWDWYGFSQIMSSAGFYLLAKYDGWPCHPGFNDESSNSYQHLRIWGLK